MEYLTAAETGVGARYRQTRLVQGREMSMEFEVLEFVPNERIRIVNEMHGTVWDSMFRFSSSTSTTLTLRMEARSRRLVPRLLMPLMLALLVKKAVAQDIDALRVYCERRDSSPEQRSPVR